MASVLYVQNFAHRAGAQTCLARLLADRGIRQWRPAVLCSQSGWLTTECERLGVPCIIVPFPRSRSIGSRLFGNVGFLRAVLGELERLSIKPVIVHANDHWEGILGIQLAKALKSRSAVFLRTSRLTSEQFYKYHCNEFDLIAAVGESLFMRTQGWQGGRNVGLYFDGIRPEEFSNPKLKPSEAPARALVIGAVRPSKGWADLVEALAILEEQGRCGLASVDFTGPLPTREENDLKLERLRYVRCNFLGRVNAFRDLVLSYDLVINASRTESFGMAALEVIAAGVPLLSSNTGVMSEVLTKSYMLFPPSQPAILAETINSVLCRWSDLDFGLAEAQQRIRSKFLVRNSAQLLEGYYRKLVSDRSVGVPAVVTNADRGISEI